MTTLNIKNLDNFKNEANTDFSNKEEVDNLKKAIEKVRTELGKTYPVVINGKKIETDDKITSVNPGRKTEVIGHVSKVDRSMAEKAIHAAADTFETWKNVKPEERAQYLFKAADVMRERRHELSAIMILEAGKNFEEADAEVSEAIDFLDFYGRSMIEIENDTHGLMSIPEEENYLKYIPLGVGFVVPPWNFPLAICTGLTVSGVVTGNTIVLKPSSSTPVTAYKFFEIMEEVGLPTGVINFIPGDSSVMGDFITEHPLTRFISFTGSKEVGLRIYEKAGKTASGQKWMKRVNAEMGGKDAVVVDETADVEEVAQGIVESAFSFQGQKCSAGSRAIVVEDIYDQVVERVVELTNELESGQGEDDYFSGPVIDQAAFDKITNYIEIGKNEGKLVAGGNSDSSEGYFIEPTVFIDLDPQARIMQEEIFGPVLAFTKAKDWREAIEINNNTEYGLTGSFYSNEEDRIQYAAAEMHCGNLYINRKCTGALVGVHPFGGFNMSGTDTKAGGYDYLKNFSQPKLYTIKRK